MVSPIPKQPFLRAGTYDDEANTFSDINDIARSFATKALRTSLSSPPLAKDVQELTLVYDKTANRLYTKIDGNLKYVAFT